MITLDEIIRNLKNKPEVDSVFLTGSHGTQQDKPYSDIDLVIVLNKNDKGIKSVYTWIDEKFADIFFLDHTDLERLASAKEYPAHAWDTVLVSWLQKAFVCFDKSGKLSALVARVKMVLNFSCSSKEQRDFWQKINYNLVANERYFKSGDPLYHEALEIRLLYSVSELIVGYFILRNISWRGEKEAMKHLKESNVEFYLLLKKYWQASNLSGRFKVYTQLTGMTFTDRYGKWDRDEIVVTLQQPELSVDEKQLADFWRDLSGTTRNV